MLKRQINNNPFISIITVVYNGENSIEQTILSVINQDFEDYEYIIIDGGSTDDTLYIINKYKKQISVIISEPDSGIYDAMNKGIALGKGQYIHFLNAGDEFYNNHVLEEVSTFLKKKKPALLIGGTIHEDVDEKIEFYNYHQIESLPSFYRKGKMICHQAMFHNKEIFKKIGCYSLDFKIVADHDWLLRFLINKSADEAIAYIDIPIAYYDMRGVSAKNRLKVIQERTQIIKLNKISTFDFISAYISLSIERIKLFIISLLISLHLYELYKKNKYSIK